MKSKTRKEQIKDAAAKLFRKQGYRGTSMDNIADAMGMKAASLYNHIKSKQAILSDLCLEVAKAFTDGMNDINQSSLTPFEKLKRIVGLHVKLTADYTDSISLVTSEWIHLSKDFKEELDGSSYEVYSRLRNEYELQFREILKKCMEEGSIRQVNIEVAIFSILSSLHWLYSWYDKNKNSISNSELEIQMVKCLIEGLAVK